MYFFNGFHFSCPERIWALCDLLTYTKKKKRKKNDRLLFNSPTKYDGSIAWTILGVLPLE